MGDHNRKAETDRVAELRIAHGAGFTDRLFHTATTLDLYEGE